MYLQPAEPQHLDQDDKTTPTADESYATIYPESKAGIHLYSSSSSKASPIPTSPVVTAVHVESYKMYKDCNLFPVAHPPM
jgi:hypothetical protein